MTNPSPLDFTVVHLRVVVPPDRAQHTAFMLASSMFPVHDPATPLDAALRWFGTNLCVDTESEGFLKSSRLRAAHRSRRCVERLAHNIAPLVLDLVHVTHTAAVRRGYLNLESQVCGYATLSLPGTALTPHIVTRNISCGTDQLCVAYQTLYSSSPGDTLTAVSQTTSVALVPLTDLRCNRPGVPTSDTNLGTSTARVADVAQYAGDNHAIWSLMPQDTATGTDLTYDLHVASLSDTAYYRVFDARTNQED